MYKQLCALLLALIPGLAIGDDYLFKHWEITVCHISDSLMTSMYIGNITNRNKPEFLYYIQSDPHKDRCFCVIRDGVTREIIGQTKRAEQSGGWFLGLFDANKDGYNEVYSTYAHYTLVEYLVIDTRDYSTRADSLPTFSCAAWCFTYDNSPEDTVLVCNGLDNLTIYTLPDFKMRRQVWAPSGSKIAVDDFDKDSNREILLFGYGLLEFYDFNTLALKYEIDFYSREYVAGRYLIMKDVNGDDYLDFIFVIEPKYEVGIPRIVIFDGRSRGQHITQLWESDDYIDMPVMGHFKYKYQDEIVALYKNSQIVVYAMPNGNLPHEEWRSKANTYWILGLAAGDLDDDGLSDLIVQELAVVDNKLAMYNSIPAGFGNQTSTVSIKPSSILQAFPNPFTSRLTLTLPSPTSIYSLTGTLIKTLPKGKQEIDTRNWKAGVYLIKCDKETKRLVKLN